MAVSGFMTSCHCPAPGDGSTTSFRPCPKTCFHHHNPGSARPWYMSYTRNRAIIIAITEAGMTQALAATHLSVSTRWVRTLVRHHKEHGMKGLHPRSRRPHTMPTKTDQDTNQPDPAPSPPADPRWPRRRSRLHLDAPTHLGPPQPNHRLAHPESQRQDNPTATQTPPLLMAPLRGRLTQRVLAVRLHPLATGRQHPH